ncbi:MAG TPA: ABC transporter ATP-binding protein [Geobacteraceae bacterium]|nr:ABC transporter ATP-binding protein [Geobacteraceae bacterium]
MDDIVIAAENVGKKYLLSHLQENREQLFSHLLVNKMKMAGAKARDILRVADSGPVKQTREEFWALKDISFAIKRGDRLGIIGRNGAGKSTLLKILSRITEPTTGRITIDGRVASLLEVGTGFHSELTGRENIYLNGAILGMSREEIRRKFDEIVAFAEVEKFLDTPVKRYSSGMYVRLAFAVAAHLEPEILIIDEVLAVGDAQFQKKCLGKMEDVSTREGRTVLFVSHNMGAIARLCQTAIWLDAGNIMSFGAAVDVLHEYQAQDASSGSLWVRPEMAKRREFSFERIEVTNSKNRASMAYSADDMMKINIWYAVHSGMSGCQIAFRLYNADGLVVFTTADTDYVRLPSVPREVGSYLAQVSIPANFLAPGTYYLSIAAHQPYQTVYDAIEQPVTFTVTTTGWTGAYDGRLGVMAPIFHWNTAKTAVPE